MQKWEYRVIRWISGRTEHEKQPNEMGELGWEFVAVDESFLYFKRPISN